jgi:hypothetical protein
MLQDVEALRHASAAAGGGVPDHATLDEGTLEAEGPTEFEDELPGASVEAVPMTQVADEAGRLKLAGKTWSDWMPLEEAAGSATTRPGVYVARSGEELVYVGMAGERRGQGVRGRLRIYARGRGAVSGLGEAALDRALADEAWVTRQLEQARHHGPQRTKDWAIAAVRRASLDVCWTPAESAEQARDWETEALLELEDAALWNKLRPSRRR